MCALNSPHLDLMATISSIPSVQFYPQKNSTTILIVEDDPDLRGLLAQCLYKGNYQVVMISSESEVLRTLAEQQIDLVLLDPLLSIMVSHTGRLSICQSIRQQYAGAIVVLGDFNPFNAKVYAQQLGADAYLSKPMRLAELHDCIQSLLPPCKGCSSLQE